MQYKYFTAYHRILYPNSKGVQNNFLIIQQIANKIKRGLIENKKKLEISLIEKLEPAHDGRGINIDWAFEGMEVVNRIADMLKKIQKEELRELFFIEMIT